MLLYRGAWVSSPRFITDVSAPIMYVFQRGGPEIRDRASGFVGEGGSCWPCGVVGDAPASSKRSGKSTRLYLGCPRRCRSLVSQGLVRPALVIEDADARLQTVGKVFRWISSYSGAPQSLDKDIVQPTPA